jgi:hypothetical protein
MVRTCIVDTDENQVINIIEYDEFPDSPPPGYSDKFIAVASDIAQIGWTWDGENLNPPPVDEEAAKAEYKLRAQNALNKTDLVALRCFKAAVEFNQSWISYTQALRTLVSSPNVDPSQPLPTQPPYPPGS